MREERTIGSQFEGTESFMTEKSGSRHVRQLSSFYPQLGNRERMLFDAPVFSSTGLKSLDAAALLQEVFPVLLTLSEKTHIDIPRDVFPQ